MGIGLVYNGFQLRPGQEILSSEHNYYSTKEALRTASLRGGGAPVREFQLYSDSAQTTVEELVERFAAALRPNTRVAALTWVHSSTGVKLPLRRMAEVVREANRGRDKAERVLLCVDGVHGFGIEDETMQSLGCDFFMTGCHKWLFGPRGTGIVWGKTDAWRELLPTIPTFRELEVRRSWIAGQEPDRPTSAASMTPGGFKAFEHLWALADAFEFMQGIGKARVAARTHHLAGILKEGLASMDHVVLYTPMSSEISSGIVCFDVKGLSPANTVARLRDRSIVASTTPYSPSYARLTPSIRNTEAEMEAVLSAIRDLG